MKINNWFENGCNYMEGVALYGSLKGHSSNLLRLFLRKESVFNIEKLKYELGKFKEATEPISKTPDKREKTPEKRIKSIEKITHSARSVGSNSVSGGFYRINELPVELHPLLIAQGSNYKLACSAHLQLTSLHPDEEGAALKLCIQIEDLFDAIDVSQKVFDHYKKHKVVLDINPRNFSDLTPAQLIQSRNNKKATVSKHKKKVDTITNQLKRKVSKSETTKLNIAFEKAERTLVQHQYELQELINLINRK
jgi:hypothetical protein